MADLKFAVIGAGFWSKFQIPAWREVTGAQLVALCDSDLAKAQAFAERFNIPRVYQNAEEMFQQETLDFVDIIAGVSAHAPLVALAAQYKVPVICQKPMAPDYATCERMVQTCRQAGIPFFIHENFRWQPPMRAIKDYLDAGRIGQPLRAQLQFGHGPLKFYSNQPYLKTDPHFVLPDMGSHFLDLARFFFGEPHSLYCQYHRSRADFAGDDVVVVMLRTAATICLCEMGWFTNTKVYIEGTQGSLELSNDGVLSLNLNSEVCSRRYTPERYAWTDPDYGFSPPSIVTCNAHLLDALKTGQLPETSAEDNLKTMRLVYAAYESAERNQVIPLV
jgi:D-apiose dehydrogenase